VHCGSWFGLEGRHEPSDDETNPSGAPMELYIGNTFWGNDHSRTIETDMQEMKAQGINMIRFPIAPQTLSTNDPQGMAPNLKNYEPLRQENARQALEDFLVKADQNDLYVLIDIHSCSNYVGWRAGRFDARPPYVDADRDNYDFTREGYSCAGSYNEATWLNNLREIAGLEQSLGIDNIIGIDIFNEPWDYTWAEWKGHIEAAYQAIDAVNPNLLIFAEGISGTAGNQDGTPDTITQVPYGDESINPNWGENLYEAGDNPPNVPKDRLVFSPHTYGPSVFPQKHFMDPAQPECEGLEGDAAGDAGCNIVITPSLLETGWEQHFGYLRDLGYAVVIGEFGGNMDWPTNATLRDQSRWGHITTNVDQQWQNALASYMSSKDIQGCYWSINPESGDTYGLYTTDYVPGSNESAWGTWTGFDNRKWSLLNQIW
jgi:aryl-phospho-beta-D-glucosidase BglC (GH1 family)